VFSQDIARDAVEVSRYGVGLNGCALKDFAGNAIDRFVGKLGRRRTAATFEKSHDAITYDFILMRRALDIRIKMGKQLVESRLR
jgi:hypothetical protein